MAGRKLPPYEELRNMVLNRNMTHQAIADTYGVSKRAVAMRLKFGSEMNGDPYPFLSQADKTKRAKASLKETRIKSVMIAGLLDDTIDEMRATAEFGRASVTRIIEELENRTGVSSTTLRKLHNRDPKVDLIQRVTAVKLLRGLGEDPHPSLLEWAPKNIYHQSNKVAAAKRAAA